MFVSPAAELQTACVAMKFTGKFLMNSGTGRRQARRPVHRSSWLCDCKWCRRLIARVSRTACISSWNRARADRSSPRGQLPRRVVVPPPTERCCRIQWWTPVRDGDLQAGV